MEHHTVYTWISIQRPLGYYSPVLNDDAWQRIKCTKQKGRRPNVPDVRGL